MLKQGAAVGLSACSDGLRREREKRLEETKELLRQTGLRVRESACLYRTDRLWAGTPKERAGALMDLYADPEIQAIFDVSGGNLANQILDELDYEKIAGTDIEFWGYSDLTVILNAIYTKTGKSSWLYQIQNLTGEYRKEQTERFRAFLEASEEKERDRLLLPDQWRFLQGREMEGRVIGGNIRCFLKLAGTEYLPDFSDHILFLESCGGGEGVIASLLAQLRQMGAFDRIRGLLLGTFTQLDREAGREKAEELAMEALEGRKLSVARTMQVGHGDDSRGIPIGGRIRICS